MKYFAKAGPLPALKGCSGQGDGPGMPQGDLPLREGAAAPSPELRSGFG